MKSDSQGTTKAAENITREATIKLHTLTNRWVNHIILASPKCGLINLLGIMTYDINYKRPEN